MVSLGKRLSARLRTKWLWVQIPLQSHKLQISRLFRARSFLKFTQLQSVDSKMRMWHDKNTQSPCNPCFIFYYVYLHTFHVNFLRKRHVSQCHRISCPSHHIKRTDKKPFTGLIGPRHMTTSWPVAHQSCGARCSPHVL